ncbi:hypothetical protein LXL04_018144 [Taraxacum kok-saghyz]
MFHHIRLIDSHVDSSLDLIVDMGSCKENGDDYSSGTTTVASSNSAVEKPQDTNGFHDPVHWVPAPGTPWSYNPWVSMPGYPLITFLPFTILEFHSVVTSGDLYSKLFTPRKTFIRSGIN